MKRKFFILVALAAVVVPIAAFFGACEGKPVEEKTLVIATTQAIDKAVRDEYNFDALASGVSEMPLIGKSAQGEYYPLAASFETADSKAWTFTVKENLKWSDGEKVTAEDIVFSLIYEGEAEKKLVFSATDSAAQYDGYELSEDKLSVKLILKKANIKALNSFATFRIRPKHIYEGKSEETLTDEDRRITCGPYKLAEFNKEAGAITFVKNEFYPEATSLDRITYRLFKDEDVMYTAFKNGEADFVWKYSVGVSADYAKTLSEANGVKLVTAAAENCPATLVFNNSKGLFTDKNLRVAAAYALNYDKFKSYFGSSQASVPNKSFVPSPHLGYKDTESLSFDIAKATEFMEKSGYKKTGEYFEKDGKRAEFTLTVNAGSKNNHASYAEFVKTQLESFGIKVNLDAVDAASYNAKTSNKFGGGKITMEAAIYGFTAFGMNTLGINYMNGNNAVQGGGQVFSEELNEIEKELTNAEGLEAYKEAAGKLQDFYAREIPAIALFHDVYVYAHSDKLTGVFADATFGLNNVKFLTEVTLG